MDQGVSLASIYTLVDPAIVRFSEWSYIQPFSISGAIHEEAESP